jgi:hypothetical protein
MCLFLVGRAAWTLLPGAADLNSWGNGRLPGKGARQVFAVEANQPDAKSRAGCKITLGIMDIGQRLSYGWLKSPGTRTCRARLGVRQALAIAVGQGTRAWPFAGCCRAAEQQAWLLSPNSDGGG